MPTLRTLRIVEKVDGKVVLDEYVLHESPFHPGSETAKIPALVFLRLGERR